MKNQRRQTSPKTAWDFSTWFVLVSPLIGVVVGFISLLLFAR